MEQVVEGTTVLGAIYTLSWIGTATATVNGSAVVNGGQVTLTGGSDVTVRMIGGTWNLLQLERGSAATTFEYRPVAAELAMCMRYYERLVFAETAVLGAVAVGINFSPPSGGFRIPFTVKKRSTPAASISSAGHFFLASVAVATVSFGSDASSVWGTFTASSGTLGANWTSAPLTSGNAAAWIAADAEF
jgi:hypothetical protein